MKTPAAPVLPRTSSSYEVFVGVDIAASTAMVAWLCPGQPISHPINTPQTAAGFALLQQTLRALAVTPGRILIVMEATGSYWERLAVSLVRAAICRECHPPASGT